VAALAPRFSEIQIRPADDYVTGELSLLS